ERDRAPKRTASRMFPGSSGTNRPDWPAGFAGDTRRRSLDAVHHVEIAKQARVAVCVRVAIARKQRRANEVDAGGVWGHEFLPQLLPAARKIQTVDSGRQFTGTVDVETAAVGSEGG